MINNYIVTLIDIKYKREFELYLIRNNIKYTKLEFLDMYIVQTTELVSKVISGLYYVQQVLIDIDIKTEIDQEFPGVVPPRGPITGRTYIDWGVEKINAPCFWDNFIVGTNIKVAVLDTGIYPHRDLRIVNQISFVEKESPIDENGHGTLIAGVIAMKNFTPDENNLLEMGVAWDCKLYNVKIINKEERVRFSSIISAFNWCLQNLINVINLGIEFESKLSIKYLGVFFTALDKLKKNNIIVVSITGNNGEKSIGTPGNIKPILAIGSVDSCNKRSLFSSYGVGINYVAPGQYIVSTYLNNTYMTSSGTSLSAAHVTGLVALLLQQNKNRTQEDIEKILTQNAIKLGSLGYNFQYGNGLVQVPANQCR